MCLSKILTLIGVQHIKQYRKHLLEGDSFVGMVHVIFNFPFIGICMLHHADSTLLNLGINTASYFKPVSSHEMTSPYEIKKNTLTGSAVSFHTASFFFICLCSPFVKITACHSVLRK